tara:strand:+ start:1858 stop:2901 length:1044 start_codon:yes stop_codon:yes gene_type:complete
MNSIIHAAIDLNAINSNLSIVRAKAPTSKVMAVIKADAYGHGAVAVAKHISPVDSFGVARVEEGKELRDAGIDAPIVILEGFLNAQELNASEHLGLDVVVHSEHQLALLSQGSFSGGIWVKVTTGMNRLGFSLSSLEEVLDKLASQKIIGIMSHLASADSDPAMTRQQVSSFYETANKFNLPLSIANSAGILDFPASHLDWVRPGLMLYGASPFSQLNADLHAAMTFSAPIIAINKLTIGQSVGYGGTWVAPRNCRVAVLAVGYADGYPREIFNGSVALGDVRRNIVGRVSMDMICVELDDHDDVSVGDEAVLWGIGLPIEEVATMARTIPYTLMCGVGKRVRRNYL